MVFIEESSKDAAFHFSVEELLTRLLLMELPVLMLWQADRTVMLGLNQAAAAEADIQFAEESGIQIVRRSSGGGAIYTDLGTLLYTIVQPLVKDAKTHKEDTAASIIAVLTKMGIPAVREGRNDILVNGCKISGLAQYTSQTHICTHGSLLFDTDLDTLTRVLIANEEKLRSKGISSIRSRVTNIKPYANGIYSIDDFTKQLKSELLSGLDFQTYKLSADELNRADCIRREKYDARGWNFRL